MKLVGKVRMDDHLFNVEYSKFCILLCDADLGYLCHVIKLNWRRLDFVLVVMLTQGNLY